MFVDLVGHATLPIPMNLHPYLLVTKRYEICNEPTKLNEIASPRNSQILVFHNITLGNKWFYYIKTHNIHIKGIYQTESFNRDESAYAATLLLTRSNKIVIVATF